MIRFRWNLLVATGLVILAQPLTAQPSATQRPDTVVFGGSSSYPPFEWLDDSGAARGFVVELEQLLTEKGGREIAHRLTSWQEALAELESGSVDAVPMFESAPRSERFLFTEPFYYVDHGIFGRVGTQGINSLDSLNDTRVAVVAESFANDTLGRSSVDFDLVPRPNIMGALQAVSDGSATVAVVARPIGSRLVREADLDLRELGPPLWPRPYVFAVSRDRPELLSWLQLQLRTVVVRGEYADLYSAWEDELEWTRPTLWDTLRRLGSILLLLLLFVGVGFLWSWQLRRRVKRRTRELREERERFRQVAENVREVFWLRSPDFQEVFYVNPAYEEITGQSAEILRENPTSWLEMLHPKDRARVEEAARGDEEGQFAEEYRIVRPDGEIRWIRDRAYPVEDERGEVVRIVGVAEDITEEKIAERERRRAEEQYETLFRVTPTAVSVATLEEGRFLEVNETFETLYGWHRDEVIDRTAEDLSLWHSETARDRMVDRLRNRGEVRDVEVRFRTRSDETLEVSFSADLLEIDGTECMLASAHDLTERKVAERELERLALRDTLTGLPNRNLFFDRLRHALQRAERQQTRVAVLYLDLDRFKIVNDTLGHPAGDTLLEQVAQRIRECFRDQDTVARLGGDEFAGILEDVVDSEEAEAVARRLTEALQPPFELSGTEVHVGASIGIALGDAGDRPEDLLRFSDVAMYRIKRSERTGYHLFDPEVDEVETRRLHRENQLRKAIELGQLRLEFQPIMRLRDGRIAGVEALVRWEHPEQGRIPPGEFIPLAEETGLIVPLGRWVLEEACRLGVLWRQKTEDDMSLAVSVNISARQYQQADFVDTVIEATEATGFPLSALALEITETIQLTGRGKLQTLREHGLRIAIDDFGTGYSSLHYLRYLEADTLKVDRTFIADLDVDPRDSVLVQAILLVARQMGLEVIAEGIETASQLEHLRQLGCPYGQGFHLGRPMPPEAFEELLETNGVAD